MTNFTMVEIFIKYLGGWDNLLKAYTSIVIIGIIVEAIVSIVNNNNLSRLTITLFAQKIVEYIIIGIGNIMDMYIVAGDTSCRKFIIIFYIAYETLKIIDNAVEIGLPIPIKIKKILKCVFNKEYDKDKKARKWLAEVPPH